MSKQKQFIWAVVWASIAGASIHLCAQSLVEHLIKDAPLLNMASQALTLESKSWMQFWSYATYIFPALGAVTAYYLLGQYLLGNNRVEKGFVFGLLMLLIKGDLIRGPVLDILSGGRIWLALLVDSQEWLVNIVVGIIIALILTPKSTLLRKQH